MADNDNRAMERAINNVADAIVQLAKAEDGKGSKGGSSTEEKQLTLFKKMLPQKLKPVATGLEKINKSGLLGTSGAKSLVGALSKFAPAAAVIGVAAKGFQLAAKLSIQAWEKMKGVAVTLNQTAVGNKMGQAAKAISEAAQQIKTNIGDRIGQTLSAISSTVGKAGLRASGTSKENVARGISNTTYNQYKANQIAGYVGSGYDYMSATALTEARTAAIDRIYNSKANDETWEEVASNLTSGKYGITTNESALAGWLYKTKGELVDTLSDQQLIARQEEFILAQSEEFAKNGIDGVSDLNNEYVELGNSIKQAGSNLYSFDAVQNTVGKQVKADKIEWDKQSGKIINFSDSIQTTTKDLEAMNDEIKLIDDNEVDLTVKLTNAGYDLEEAESIVSYLMSETDRETRLKMIWSLEQMGGAGDYNTLSDVVEAIDYIKANGGAVEDYYSQWQESTGGLSAKELQHKSYWEQLGVNGNIRFQDTELEAFRIADEMREIGIDDEHITKFMGMMQEAQGTDNYYDIDKLGDLFSRLKYWAETDVKGAYEDATRLQNSPLDIILKMLVTKGIDKGMDALYNRSISDALIPESAPMVAESAPALQAIGINGSGVGGFPSQLDMAVYGSKAAGGNTVNVNITPGVALFDAANNEEAIRWIQNQITNEVNRNGGVR